MSTPRVASAPSGRPSHIILAAFLTKFAKHVALLACLAIIGQATGRDFVGQCIILLLIVGAAVIHTLGRTIKRRHVARAYRNST